MKWLFVLVLLLAAAAVAAGVSKAPHDDTAERLTGGSVERGRVALRQYACSTCHVIPGVAGAESLVGPPLNGVARRHFLGGRLPNTPDNLVRWIRSPQTFEPLSAMPDLGVSEPHARDMAAYLYSLR